MSRREGPELLATGKSCEVRNAKVSKFEHVWPNPGVRHWPLRLALGSTSYTCCAAYPYRIGTHSHINHELNSLNVRSTADCMVKLCGIKGY
jgi:hypothetical protein